MKIILLSLLVLSGAIAKAQHQNSQASQIITLRLQPVSFIDFTTAEKGKATPNTPAKEEAPSTAREIIVNRNTPQTAALPPSTPNHETHTPQAYAFNESEPVYTFSSR